MKLLEQKEKELQRISNEIKKLSQGNPQQQRKCARLKEDHQRLVQEIQKLRENQNKDKKGKLDELRKQIEANEGNEKVKRRNEKKEYEELRKMLGVGKELKENAERIDDYNENTSSLKTDENMYLDEQHLKVKPIQKDQYGVYEQKKIESEAENTFIIRKANLCELESDIDDVRKRMANPIIQKFEAELKLIRKKIIKLERRINKINEAREICVTALAEMNLSTKRMLFDLMGFVMNILRNALYIVAWIRDSITKSLLRALSNATFRGRHNGPIAIRTKRASSQTSQEGSSIRLHLIWPVTEVMKKNKTSETSRECLLITSYDDSKAASTTFIVVAEVMKSLCAPVLAIERGDGLDGRPVLLASNGCMVDSYQRDQNDLLLSQQQISVFEERKCNIYGLTYLDKRDILFAHGEKLIAIIRQFSSIPQKQVFTFKDWIQALYVFNKQKESEHSLELVTLSINNAVQLFRLNIFGGSSGVNIKEVTTVKSDYRAVITHSLLDGDSWNTLRTVVGTVIGDIIISFPSKSSSPFHVLKHHTGMIFGLLIKCNFLFSISDDRSLHMWSLDRACHINECYGHSTRPFSICNGPENIIFTGSQDGSICMWLIGESFVSLLKLIHTRYGVIRSFLFISQELFFGTGCGFFGSITFPENIENMQTIDIIYPNLSVQSFVTLSQQFYYLLDSQGSAIATFVNNA
ncbi:hypothetical protein DINM_006584 [Dirofilaria immitis]|nr:hypothetical protein [Dirofilaria immitis]